MAFLFLNFFSSNPQERERERSTLLENAKARNYVRGKRTQPKLANVFARILIRPVELGPEIHIRVCTPDGPYASPILSFRWLMLAVIRQTRRHKSKDTLIRANPFLFSPFFPSSFPATRSPPCKAPPGVIKSVDNGEEEGIKYRTRDELRLLGYGTRVVWVDEGAGEEVVLPYNLSRSM